MTQKATPPETERERELTRELHELRSEVETLRERVAQVDHHPGLTGADTSAQLFAALLELPLVVYRVGADGRFRHVAGKAIARLGLEDASSLVGREVLSLFPEARTEFLESLAGNAVWSESSGELNGHPWATINFVSPVSNGDGTVGVSLDVTDWKFARSQLAASERRFRSLAETVDVPISRTDLAGKIVYANESLATMLGIPASSLVGRHSFEFVVEDDQTRILEDWAAAYEQNRDYAGTFRIRRATGEAAWVINRTSSEVDERGEITGFVSSLTDITDRKQIEDDLSKRVAERTEQLVLANKELESFCYSVSHDLRAPLRSIDGFCHLLGEELGASASETARDCLRRVRGSSKRMDRLIDDFLVLSRSSLAEVTRSNVDLSALAHRIVADLGHRVPDRRVRFEIAQDVKALGDSGLLHDVMENLIGNAFKFTANTADPFVEFFATTTDTDEKAYAIRDNGVGFNMAHATKLFTAFHRLHDESEFEGTGVGLATVDRIIRRHGGRVWAQSAPGRGATFFFTLPGV